MMQHRTQSGLPGTEKVNVVEGPEATQRVFVALFKNAGVKGRRRTR